MKQNFILINLNQVESDQSRSARFRENLRWSILTVLVLLLFGGNTLVWYMGINYDKLLHRKEKEITQIRNEISQLLEKGKNLSKQDILMLAELENNRFMWAECLQRLGNMTFIDMSLTGLKFKNNKLLIQGIASTYKGKKEFEQIENFIHTLNSDLDFSRNFVRLKLKHHELLKVRSQEIVSFEIEASLKSVPHISKQIKKSAKSLSNIVNNNSNNESFQNES